MTEDKTVERTTETDNSTKQGVNKPAVVWYRHEHKPFVLAGLAIIFVLLLAVAFEAGHHAWRRDEAFGGGRFTELQRSPGRMHAYGGGFQGGMIQGSGAAASNTHVSGVVTAVDGNTITVAGEGTTTKITVSSNTTYTGSSEPAKANDTIIAIGAKDASGTLVASNVYLSRQ